MEGNVSALRVTRLDDSLKALTFSNLSASFLRSKLHRKVVNHEFQQWETKFEQIFKSKIPTALVKAFYH